MGLHQIVVVKLSCQRCGKVEGMNLFFDGNIVSDDVYELGAFVPETALRSVYYSGVFSMGEKYEGNASRYCWSCFVKWGVAQASSGYESLAELIESGRVRARIKEGTDGVWLLPLEVLEYSGK